MDDVYKNKIWIRYNQSETLQVTALRLIQGVHPRVAHRDGFIYYLQEAIHFEMTENERLKITELPPQQASRATQKMEKCLNQISNWKFFPAPLDTRMAKDASRWRLSKSEFP
jgi:hypothetical protein